MATIITGLFPSQSQADDIALDLKSAGFPDSSYIMYLHEKPIPKEIKTSIWRSFFKDSTTLQDDSLAVSVKAKEPTEKEKINEIFTNHGAIHQKQIENIKFDDAKSLQNLRKIAAIRAKAAIYSAPEIRHHNPSSGISSEVSF